MFFQDEYYGNLSHEKTCGCDPPCTTVAYNVRISEALFPNGFALETLGPMFDTSEEYFRLDKECSKLQFTPHAGTIIIIHS